MNKSLRARLAAEDGAEAVSFVLLAPILILFFEMILIGGRLATIQADMASAAREAARQASLASGEAAAGVDIHAIAVDALESNGLDCRSPMVFLGDDTNFVRGGWVEVEVTCTIDLSDIGMLSVPGAVTITRSSTEPIDFFRVVEEVN